MKIIDKTRQLKRLSELLEKEITGNSVIFAKKIGISRTHLFELLEELKALGVPISYDRKSESYYYSGDKRLEINTPIKVVDDQETQSLINEKGKPNN